MFNMNKFFACLLSSVVLLVSISCNISAEEATNEIDEPRMGLIWDENELNSDMFETSPESEISAYASLPKSVDLSKSPCFPPIGNQKSLGACGPFATTYYQFSYEVNKLNNVTSASQRCVYSPKWTYNLVNKGEDKGTSIGKCYEVLKNLGSLKNADFPYTGDKDDYLDFPSMQKQEKVDALKTRVSNLYTIDISSNKQISSPNSAELNTIKTMQVVFQL